VRACPECGSSLAADQAYCLECGAATPVADAFKPPRTLGLVALALGIVAVAASAAYGITMDTKPGHKHQLIGLAPKPPAPAPPPATAATPPPSSATPAKPVPTPPKIKPAPPAPHAATPSPPAVAPSHPSGGTSSSSGSSSSSGGSRKSSGSKSHSGSGSSNGSAGFSTGDTPTDARVFPAGSGDDDKALRAADDDNGTSWTTGKANTGIFVDAGGYTTYTSLGIVTKTPGYDVQVYATTQDPAPGQIGQWTLVGSHKSISSRQKVKITQQPQSGDWRYYLIEITKLPGKGSAGISEVALLQ
jgi:hypothetical protein